MASTPTDRLHTRLLAYLRLLIADPNIAARHAWPNTPLHTLRTQHPDRGARLLAIQILSRQRGWSEVKRMAMEREWVGPVNEAEADILYGWEVEKLELGFGLKRITVDGWVLPILEAKRRLDGEQITAT